MTFMLITVFGALFAFIVGAAEGDEGFVLGLLLGVLSGLYLSLRNKFGRLERRLADTEQALDALADAAPSTSLPDPGQPIEEAVAVPRDAFVTGMSAAVATPTEPPVASTTPPSEPESQAATPDPWNESASDGFRQPPGARRRG